MEVRTFARALEHAFMSHIDNVLAKPMGVVYLADTVRLSWLTRVNATTLTRGESWVATETSRLEDYLHECSNVQMRRQWNWFRHTEEKGFWGRLYGVQALAYRTPPEN